MNFIKTIYWVFDTSLRLSDTLPLAHDGKFDLPSSWRFFGGIITRKNHYLSEDLKRDRNEELLQNYVDYCEENYCLIKDSYHEYMRDLGYSCMEGVDDGWEEFCQEDYTEYCATEWLEVPLFPETK